ncbi:hypothetical protein K435DRAFT_791781 [Dendrothele bispora CBS 962.96]|uniref:FAD/NAD(P)-binding domain-containing protein n=1 Tax=Dendrothele bispora (strain CBS 962.96) TaxID=1314807 RepID=A0A4S8MKV2_DENBC|nr:hypothetical protein K435DRAFT_791781 [Dendrothele bispora CBS 962.96]
MTEASSSTTVTLHGAWPLGDPFISNGNSNSRTIIPIASASRVSSSTQATITTTTSTTCTNSRLEEKCIMMVQRYTGRASRGSGSNASYSVYEEMIHVSALSYAIQLSVNSYDAGGGATMFSCDLDPPNFNSNSDPDLDLQARCVHWVISSIPTMTTPTSFSTQTISGSNVDFATNAALTTWSFILHRFSVLPVTALSSIFLFPTFNPRPGVIGPQPGIYLAQANLNSVLSEDFMGNGFTTGGQRTATVNESIYPTVRSDTDAKLRRDEEPETADTVIVATGVSATRLGLRGEETYWRSWISACAVCDGAVPISRNTPLAVIGGGVSAPEKAPCSYIHIPARHNELRATKIIVKRPLPKCRDNSELPENFWIRNVQTDGGKDLAMNRSRTRNGDLSAPNSRPIRTDTLSLYLERFRFRIRGIDKAITSAGSGCMAALKVERLVAEEKEKEKEMMGE